MARVPLALHRGRRDLHCIDSPRTPSTQAIFMLCYLALTLHLAYSLYKFAVSKQWTNVMSSNKPQVILALALGSLFRLPTVLETNCVIEEVFRLFKDVSTGSAVLLLHAPLLRWQARASTLFTRPSPRPGVHHAFFPPHCHVVGGDADQHGPSILCGAVSSMAAPRRHVCNATTYPPLPCSACVPTSLASW